MKDYTNNIKKDEKGTSFLKINNLTVQFGGLTALQDINLEVKERGIRGIIGPNGAGKTTLFNTITGFIKPVMGDIQFQEESILGMAPHDIAEKGIIRTFQNRGVFLDMSVLENVMTGYYRLSQVNLLNIALNSKNAKKEENIIKEKSLNALKVFELENYSEKRAGDLSFGLQRVVEIVRALITYPRLLLLDEPAAGLAASERNDLELILKKISQENGIDILLTDHSMDFVMRICDYITVLNFGQKIGEGTPQEIQRNEEVIGAYLGKG